MGKLCGLKQLKLKVNVISYGLILSIEEFHVVPNRLNEYFLLILCAQTFFYSVTDVL